MKSYQENMEKQMESINKANFTGLRADCKNCFGFCCVALYFSASEGFPVDKIAGEPCPNLQSDFRCSVHKKLNEMGLKGCTAYDCFGAGQKVAQIIYNKCDWHQAPESAKQMFDVFLVIRQINEMLWYLAEASTLMQACHIKTEIDSMMNKTERLTFLSPDDLIELDVAEHRANVNILLLKISKLVRNSVSGGKKTPLKHRNTFGGGVDFIGADLRKNDLRGESFRGAYLIAADLRKADLSGTDFIGADLRDADIRGADLSNSIFLTQAQINTAKGDIYTKLPVSLTRPSHWLKTVTIDCR